MSKQKRIVLSALCGILLGAMAVYRTAEHNGLDYQEHPIASILGALTPPVIGAFALYWLIGRFGFQKRLGEGSPDQRYYETVAKELETKFLRAGLRARAVAETGDEGAAARALYIRYRVAELIQEEQEERARVSAETQRRAAEAEQAELCRREAEAMTRDEQERQRQSEIPAERSYPEKVDAANPHLFWISLVSTILAIALILLLSFWLSRLF